MLYYVSDGNASLWAVTGAQADNKLFERGEATERPYMENTDNKSNKDIKEPDQSRTGVLKIKKGDMVVFAVILVIAVISLILTNAYKKRSTAASAYVRIVEANGDETVLPLSKDASFKAETSDGGYNEIVIKDGTAYIEAASCPDKICVHHRPIRYNGETVVCLPNKLVIEIINGEKTEIDSVAGGGSR